MLTSIQLIRADDPDKKPLVTFHPHRRHFWVFRMSKHAYFEVQQEPEVTEALDKLIGKQRLIVQQDCAWRRLIPTSSQLFACRTAEEEQGRQDRPIYLLSLTSSPFSSSAV